MSNAFHYQNTFDDPLAQEFRKIFSLEFLPPQLAGLQLWLDSDQSDAFTLDAQGYIERWTDYSGNEHHATQSNTADRPIISSNMQNDIAGVFFDYSANKPMLVSGYTPTSADSLTAFIVAKRVDDSSEYGGGSVYKSLLSSGRPDSSSVEVGKFNMAESRDTGQVNTITHLVNAYNTPLGTMRDGKAHLLVGRFSIDANNDGYNEGRGDGITEELDDFTAAADADEILPMEIGGSQSASSRRFWGTIYEVVVFNRALTDSELDQMERYLSAKWALNIFGELNTAEKLRIVAKGGLIPTGLYSGGAYVRNETRKQLITGGQPIDAIRFVYGNSYIANPSYQGAAVSNGGEKPNDNAITVSAALELTDPVQTVPMTFNGASAVTLQPGEIIVSDPIRAFDLGFYYFVANSILYARTATVVGLGDKWPQLDATSISLERSISSNGDDSQLYETGALSIPSGASSSQLGFGPVAVVGQWENEPDVSLIILGDSIITGANDDKDDGSAGGGFATEGTRAVNSRTIPSIKLSRGADRADSWSLGNGLRKHLMQYATHLIENYGTNDMAAGFTAAQTLAAKQTIWDDFRESSKGDSHVISIPIAPRSSSIDSWMTLGKQTVTGGFENGGTKRDSLNSSISALVGLSNGPDSIIDVNLDWAGSALRDKWAVNGTVNYATSDGIHPSKTMHDLAALRVTTAATSWTTD